MGDEEEERVVFELVELLRKKGYAVVSQVQPAGISWPLKSTTKIITSRRGRRLLPFVHGAI